VHQDRLLSSAEAGAYQIRALIEIALLYPVRERDVRVADMQSQKGGVFIKVETRFGRVTQADHGLHAKGGDGLQTLRIGRLSGDVVILNVETLSLPVHGYIISPGNCITTAPRTNRASCISSVKVRRLFGNLKNLNDYRTLALNGVTSTGGSRRLRLISRPNF
jgi:hypothetical protein